MNSEELGIVKIGSTDFSYNCGWEVVVDIAIIEARKIGGNAIKITEHIKPNIMGNSCHNITAKILKVENFYNLPVVTIKDSSIISADYALLHVYRKNDAYGSLVIYDLHLGDDVICRVKNNWKETIEIKKDGLNTLWAKTGIKKELPINIKYGQEYYIRCSVTMGVFVGRPKIELVDNSIGKSEFESGKIYKSKNKDLIIMDDGRKIDCLIDSEDSDNVYITIFKQDTEIKTQISKTYISSIQKSDNQ